MLVYRVTVLISGRRVPGLPPERGAEVRRVSEPARDPSREYHTLSDQNVPVEIVGDRMNASRDILDEH